MSKIKFYRFCPVRGKIFLAIPGKIFYRPPGKSPSNAHDYEIILCKFSKLVHDLMHCTLTEKAFQLDEGRKTCQKRLF